MTISERDAACRGQREDRARARASMEVGPGASSMCAGVTSVGHERSGDERGESHAEFAYGRQRERERASVGWGTLTRAHAQRHVMCWVGRRQCRRVEPNAARRVDVLWQSGGVCVCDVWASAWTHTSMTCGPRDEVLCSSRTCCVVQRRRNGGPLREREVYNYVTALHATCPTAGGPPCREPRRPPPRASAPYAATR